MKPVKTAVIGCGAISDIYLTNMTGRYATLDVVACCASLRENAEKKAAQYGIRAASTEEILADPEVELIVVLTPAPSHYELVKKALLAGKHVYTEKPIATELFKAQELLALATERGLLLGAAPETFMGSAVQTTRKALNEGLIGELTSFHVVANRDLTVLASFAKFLRQPGGGICYDYGVYYLTALVSLLGPVESVFAKVGNHSRVRRNMIPDSPEFGQEYIYDNEAQVNAILTTKSGVTGLFLSTVTAPPWIRGILPSMEQRESCAWEMPISSAARSLLCRMISSMLRGSRWSRYRSSLTTAGESAWQTWQDASGREARRRSVPKCPVMCWTLWRKSWRAEKADKSARRKPSVTARQSLRTGNLY